ncbi:MAG: RagB/SusD family nutrient uptake outer membrane protein [Chitinophagaceae bacterium]|nr:RagB/SusD family nutrient uptake outer membrane protein [Chitinophagaceae bacterium]
MKKIAIFIILAGLVTMTACDKKLNLVNPQSIGAADAFSTSDKVKKVLVANYAAMGAASLFGGDALWMSELMASGGDLNWVGTFPEPKQIWGKTILVSNSYVAATYSQAYRVIFNANNILANISVVAAAEQAKVSAEAKFQRALAYFELVKFFGEKPYFAGGAASLKGVPLITAPGPNTPQDAAYLLPRSSVEAVYQQIITDLTQAETDLPAKNGFYANKPSASLALARVYLQQDKFAEARDAAHRCITVAEANGFSLVGNYSNAFNNSANTTEDLFAMQVTDQAGTNSCFTYFSTDTYGARDGDIEVTAAHYAKYSVLDTRRSLFFFEYGEWRCGKWRDIYKNVKFMRLAEAYLTRAECNRRLSTTTGATPEADLHKTRGRAGLVLLAAPTLQQILDERELELAFEGQGLWDAKRLRLTVDGNAWNSDKMTFPIPLRERNVNPDLAQNPGY